MGLSVNTNIAAMNAYRNLSITENQMSKSLEKLSSGLRINRSADDAAGLAISEGLRSQISGLKVAVRNTQDGISVVQTAEGALNETQSILHRMRDLAVQSANGGAMDPNAQAASDQEFSQLKTELGRIAKTTAFGTQQLLTADATTGASSGYNGTFQVGANNTANEQIKVDLSSGSIQSLTGFTAGTSSAPQVGISGVDASNLGINSNNVASTSSAQLSITAVDNALKGISTLRANLGAYQNRFEHTVNNLNVAIENVTASESRIRDTDMAQEMTNFSRTQILTQAGTAMLAQANQSTQGILKLLG